jgi:hypothetical protein
MNFCEFHIFTSISMFIIKLLIKSFNNVFIYLLFIIYLKVYKYATSMSCSDIIVERILFEDNEKKDYLNMYFTLLKV